MRRERPGNGERQQGWHRNPAREAARTPEMGWGGGTGERAQCWAEKAAGGPEGGGEACQSQAVEKAAGAPCTPRQQGPGEGRDQLRVTGSVESRLPGPH